MAHVKVPEFTRDGSFHIQNGSLAVISGGIIVTPLMGVQKHKLPIYIGNVYGVYNSSSTQGPIL